MAYGVPKDVRALNGFPDASVVDDPTLNGWLNMRAGELNMMLRAKGVTVPVTAPDDIVQTLKLANVYGAAAMLASAPSVTIPPDQLQATVDVWLSEFKRLEGLLAAFTTGDLINLGVAMDGTTKPTRTAPSLVLAGNRRVRCEPHWADAYPFRRRS